MDIKHTIIVFDAADIEAESTFWAALTGGRVEKTADWHSIRVADRPFMAVQLAPDHVPPQWPDGSPQQMHVDLHIDDISAGEAEVLALGAQPLQAVDHEGFRVYADPAGHPFCLCW